MEEPPQEERGTRRQECGHIQETEDDCDHDSGSSAQRQEMIDGRGIFLFVAVLAMGALLLSSHILEKPRPSGYQMLVRKDIR
jgi:hypothetical protein